MAELQLAQERLSRAFDALMDPAAMLSAVRDEQGRIVDYVFEVVNDAMARYVGFPVADIVQKTYLQVAPVAHDNEFLDLWRHTIETGEPLVLDSIPMLHLANRSGSVDLTNKPRFELRATRAGDGIVCTFRDVTTQIKAAQQVAESERMFRLLAENTTDIVVLSKDGRYRWFSPSITAALGWTPAEMIGQEHLSFVHPDDLDLASSSQNKVAASGKSYSKYRYRHKDGSYHWVSVSAGPFIGEDGTQQGNIATARVVDADVEAERQLAELSAERTRILEKIPVGVFRVRRKPDGSWVADLITKRAADLVGLNVAQAMADPTIFATVIQSGDMAKWIEAANLSLATREPLVWQGRRSGNGPVLWLRLEASFEKTATGDVVMEGLLQDITATKSYEAQLIEARAVAESATQAKSVFLSTMSHEIRTPLSAVLGLLRLLLDSNLTDQQQSYAIRMEQAAQTLLSLINDILDNSKIEAGGIELHSEPFSFEEMLQQLAVVAAANLGEKDLDLMFDIDPNTPATLIGDELRLRQVLINLVSNAVKFTEAGDVAVTVRVIAMDDTSVQLRFSIQDTGIGMTPEQQSRVFEGFVQAESKTARTYGGTGLGLTISQRLLEMRGSRIEVTSTPGVGSTFSFVVSFPTPPGVGTIADIGQPSQPCSVLIVGARPRNLDLLQRMCSSLAWHVVSASGSQLESTVRSEFKAGRQPQVALLDSHDWAETEALARQLRSLCDEYPAIGYQPVILALTTHDTGATEIGTSRSPFDGILVKPFTVATLLNEVTGILSGRLSGSTLEAREEKQSNRRLAGIRVLLVDDNDLGREIAAEMLQRAGAVVSEAIDGQQVVDMVAAEASLYDVVLMDVRMPKMDGLEATRQIRALPHGRNLPILAMTANALTSERQECLAAGMNDFIRKPFDIDNLIARIRRWTKPRRSRPGKPASQKPVQESAPTPQASPTSTVSADSQLLNVLEGLARVDGDEEFYREMAGRFSHKLPATLQHIEDAATAGDAAGVEQAAHGLKGLAGMLAANAMSQQAAALEQALKDGATLSDVVGELTALRETGTRTIVAVEDWLAGHPSTE